MNNMESSFFVIILILNIVLGILGGLGVLSGVGGFLKVFHGYGFKSQMAKSFFEPCLFFAIPIKTNNLLRKVLLLIYSILVFVVGVGVLINAYSRIKGLII